MTSLLSAVCCLCRYDWFQTDVTVHLVIYAKRKVINTHRQTHIHEASNKFLSSVGIQWKLQLKMTLGDEVEGPILHRRRVARSVTVIASFRPTWRHSKCCMMDALALLGLYGRKGISVQGPPRSQAP